MKIRRARRRDERPLLYVIPAGLLLFVGFGILILSSLGDRLSALEAAPLPVSAALVTIGGLLLSRTLLSVFFVFIVCITALFFGIRDYGLMNFYLIPFALLLIHCVPMAIYARR